MVISSCNTVAIRIDRKLTFKETDKNKKDGDYEFTLASLAKFNQLRNQSTLVWAFLTLRPQSFLILITFDLDWQMYRVGRESLSKYEYALATIDVWLEFLREKAFIN
jgi:hypothetical protein